MNNKTFEIHISDVRTFLKCRRQWNWTSPIRMNMEPRKPYTPFYVGRAVHHCLEEYYLNGIPFERSLALFKKNEHAQMEELMAVWPEEITKLEEELDMVLAILNHYGDHWADNETGFRDDNLEFIAMEQDFIVPLVTKAGKESKTLYLAGRFDGIVQKKDDGTFWIFETKTTRSIDEMERSLFNDLQAAAYLWAAKRLGNLPLKGVLYNFLKKAAPTAPDILQSGMLAQRKNLQTTFSAYMREIRLQHPDWEDDTIWEMYGDFLYFLQQKPNDFFRRVGILRSPYELKQFERTLFDVAKEMSKTSISVYPHPNWSSCNFCMFREPCTLMNKGHLPAEYFDDYYVRKVVAKSMRETETIGGEYEEG